MFGSLLNAHLEPYCREEWIDLGYDPSAHRQQQGISIRRTFRGLLPKAVAHPPL